MGAVVGTIVGFLLGLVLTFSAAGTFGFFGVFLPFIVGGLGFWLGNRAENSLNEQATKEVRAQEEQSAARLSAEFNLDEVFVNSDDDSFIGISWENAQLRCGKPGVPTRAFPLDKITHVELQIETKRYSETDGSTSTSRSSQIIGAAVGGAAFGAGGALVGGLTGKQNTISVTTETSYVTGILLRLRVLDRRDPLMEIEFYNEGRGRAYWAKLADRKPAAERFHAHLSNIIFENRERSLGASQP